MIKKVCNVRVQQSRQLCLCLLATTMNSGISCEKRIGFTNKNAELEKSKKKIERNYGKPTFPAVNANYIKLEKKKKKPSNKTVK